MASSPDPNATEPAAHDAPLEHVFRWDLDKTYLATDFDTLPELVRTFLQKPQDKTNVPGSDALLRELLHPEWRHRRAVTFISGSPRQMRRVLEEKLRLDGIEPDDFVLKPNLQNLLRGRLRALRGQIGYKLDALMTLRRRTALAPETLFGDDAEQDALIYCLYDDITAGRVGLAWTAELLEQARVYPDVIERILELIQHGQPQPTVSRVFINLDRHTPTSSFQSYGARLVPIHNYFQAALVLFHDRVLSPDAVLRVALGMHQRARFSPNMLANSFQDLVRRRRIGREALARLTEALPALDLPPDGPLGLRPRVFIDQLTQRLQAIPDHHLGPLLADPVGAPDYHALIHHHRKRHKAPRFEPLI